MEPDGKKFSTLALGGGGSKGISVLGTLDYFHKQGSLSSVKRISGTSIGSVIGSLIGIGLAPETIHQIGKQVETPLQGKVNYAKVLQNYGLWSLSKSLAPFIVHLLEYFGKSPTFEEYYQKTSVHLKVCASNLNKLESVYFDHMSFPKVEVIDALRASCCIPGIFKAVKIKGDHYVDGGFVKNFPLDAWESIAGEEILGIAVSGTPTRKEIANHWDYLARIASLAIMSHVHSATKSRPDVLIVRTVLEDVPLIPAFMSEEQKEEIYKRGQLDGKTYDSKKILILE